MPPAIEIENLRKTYIDGKKNQHKEALKGIDLTVPRGAFFWAAWPEWCGQIYHD